VKLQFDPNQSFQLYTIVAVFVMENVPQLLGSHEHHRLQTSPKNAITKKGPPRWRLQRVERRGILGEGEGGSSSRDHETGGRK
jgi:hypothetical protein